MEIQESSFGTLDGKEVTRYDLTLGSGVSLSLINYGASLIDVKMPDRNGDIQSIVTGFDDLEAYLKHEYYFGATVGRFCNRIANAAFSINGQTYQLDANNGPNNLHSGPEGFNKQIWKARSFTSISDVGVRFSYVSRDGESGFPGTLAVQVTYTLSAQGRIRIDYRCETNKTTPVNPTHHSYWNLGGFSQSETVLDHELRLNATHWTPVNEVQIPTAIAEVEGTEMDFREFHTLGRSDAPQESYDNNWVIDGKGLREAAVLQHKVSGRRLTVLSDRPGIQVYTGKWIGTIPERNGKTYPFMGVALETQNIPDCVNNPDFPNCLLHPGEVFTSTTIFQLDLI